MSFKITILGCGTSTGVPVPGCKCQVCKSQDPKNYRNRTSCLISVATGENILIDAGPDLRQQALNFNVNRVDAVLFTHSHSDHILGIDDLRSFNFSRNTPIPSYAEAFTFIDIKKMFHYLFEENSLYKGGLLAKLDFNLIEPLQTFNLFNLDITPFRLMHGDIKVTGFKINDFVYSTDCNFIPQESLNLIKNCSVLILDGLRFRAHNTHFTIDQSIEVSKVINCKKTYLIHMSHDIDYHEDSKKLPQNVYFSYDGLTIEF